MATYAGKTYTNGNVPASILAPLDGDNYGNAVLRLDAAESYNRARAEVKAKTGVVLTVRGWNRSYAEQVTFYLQRHRRAGAGDRVCCYWNGVPYVFTGTAHAAPPGTSNHGWGLAVDVVDFGGVGNFSHPRRVASIAILKKHGWTDDEGRGSIREPWHLVYNPAKDTQKNATPTLIPASTGGFMADLTEKQQRQMFHNVNQTEEVVRRLEEDMEARREADLKHQRASAARERLLVEGMKTLAGSVGVDPKTIERLLADAFKNITITLSTEA
ncbi:M15 family metallopeptidase [Promicromonospora iranensis]|uniref:D-alanyl-D-alanine carboxypeptidase-like protein n=1 Tax=Promicromonospora iranensis TaxID=1105144 RepID=A0ABU2CV31_9MICO|nr:M15 family metallopeptidase [Promicromonospora iranensis]MDR7385197.1 hypothetical protein [Promicromonospora iranensis]